MNRILLTVLLLNVALFSLTLLYEWRLYRTGVRVSNILQNTQVQSVQNVTAGHAHVAVKDLAAHQVNHLSNISYILHINVLHWRSLLFVQPTRT